MFHVWRSFIFDENIEIIDAYVTCIRQITAILGYGKPQILEVFKNTIPIKLHWILFPIENLRQVVETVKRLPTKEKLDRQLTGQSSSTLFMSIRDGNNRKVSFDTKEELGYKIDKLAVMIGKLATRGSGIGKQFKPQIYQNRGRGQNRNDNLRNYQNRYRSNSGDRRQYRQDRDWPRYEQNYRRGKFRGTRMSFDRQNSRGENRTNYRNDRYDRSRKRFRERSFSRNYNNNRKRRSRSGSRASTNRDKIGCYKYRGYDHIMRDCPPSSEEKEIEQLQQMLNLGDQQTSLISLISFRIILVEQFQRKI